ncbi:DUF4232 domain-containing protein [Streptomyces sp. M10(2022)]
MRGGLHADALGLLRLPRPGGRRGAGSDAGPGAHNGGDQSADARILCRRGRARTGRSEPAASTADCPASGAVVEMGQVQAAMFHRAVVLTLTNCGTKPYRVHGYPSVRALDEDGRRIPVPVNAGRSMFGDDQGPQDVTLEPHGKVTSILAWVSTKEGGDLIEGTPWRSHPPLTPARASFRWRGTTCASWTS